MACTTRVGTDGRAGFHDQDISSCVGAAHSTWWEGGKSGACLDGPRSLTLPTVMRAAQPGLITAFNPEVVTLWSEAPLGPMLVRDNNKYTLPQALTGLYCAMQYNSNCGGLSAGLVIVVLPIIVVYVGLGRRIAEGLTVGVSK